MKIDPAKLLGKDILYSVSADRSKVNFRCICGKHNSPVSSFNASIFLDSGMYSTYGTCGTVYRGFRGLSNKAESRKRQMELFEFLRSRGLEPKLRLVRDSEIQGRFTERQFFGDIIAGMKLAVGSPYLRKRGVPEELIRRFRIFHKPDDSQIAFSLTNYRNIINGVQIRYTDSRKMKYRIVRDVRTNVSPLGELAKFDRAKPLYIAEGFFSVLRLARHGYQAVCALGKSGLRNEEYLSGFEKVVGVFDADEAGEEYAKRLLKMQLNSYVCKGAEYDECTKDELETLLETETRYIRNIGEYFKPEPINEEYVMASSGVTMEDYL